jgi:glucose-6-phosphate isomerase/transaldolase/glucose-6-phosphate isomerase
MADRCSATADENPALVLGVAMAVLAESGRDKLTIATSPRYAAFGDWAEQLVAESTGKEGTGIVPVVREPLGTADAYGDDRFFVVLESGEKDAPSAKALGALAKAGHPVLRLPLSGPQALGAEFFRWEAATAIACSLLKVNPFDQPDVQAAKDRTKAILKTLEAGKPLELHTSEIPYESFWENAEAGDYVALLAFLPNRPELRRRLEALAADIRQQTRMAVTVGIGPRYLHSTGQLHKGGPNTGIFVLFTAPPAEDLPVPGDAFSFGQLEQAQAMGDFEALESKGRWLVHARLAAADTPSLEAACAALSGAIRAQVAADLEAEKN